MQMVSGHFVESNEADENDTVMAIQTWTEEQVLMGTDNGAIYIMANFQVKHGTVCQIGISLSVETHIS